MTKEQIQLYLVSLESKLISKDPSDIVLTRSWANNFPSESGVYIVIEEGQICYVGETGSLRARMKDLLDTRNHVLRRKIGNQRFKDYPGFEKATAHKKFNTEIESELNRWIESNMKISTLVVELGRKELEEFICKKYNRPKHNAKGKRGEVWT